MLYCEVDTGTEDLEARVDIIIGVVFNGCFGCLTAQEALCRKYLCGLRICSVHHRVVGDAEHRSINITAMRPP